MGRCACGGSNDTCTWCWGTGFISRSNKLKASRAVRNPWEFSKNPYTVPKNDQSKWTWVDFALRNRLSMKPKEGGATRGKAFKDKTLWAESNLIADKDRKISRIKSIRKIRAKKRREENKKRNKNKSVNFKQLTDKYASSCKKRS